MEATRLSRYKIAALPVTAIDHHWPNLVPIINDVVSHSYGEATSEVAYEQMKLGNLLTLIVLDDISIIAVALLEIRTFDTGVKALHIPVFGGKNMEEWADDMMDVLHALARDFGCTQLRGVGARKGWIRRLQHKDYGWKELNVTIGCDVKSK